MKRRQNSIASHSSRHSVLVGALLTVLLHGYSIYCIPLPREGQRSVFEGHMFLSFSDAVTRTRKRSRTVADLFRRLDVELGYNGVRWAL